MIIKRWQPSSEMKFEYSSNKNLIPEMDVNSINNNNNKKSSNECEGQPDEFLLIYESESWTRNTAEEPS